MALLHEKPHKWTVKEFHRLCEEDFFGPDAHVELIEGDIVVVTAQGPMHREGIRRVTEKLVLLMHTTHWVQCQFNVDFEEYSSPEPDFSIVRKALPADAELDQADLLVEVSFSRLKFDRVEKGSLYAMADVPEYWILNVRDGVLEVHREPRRDAQGHFGFKYQSVQVLPREASASPLCRPDLTVVVADLLP